MNNCIIITSIFHPTKAVTQFSKLTNYKLIVVGDKKTPEDWFHKNVDFLSLDQQKTLDYFLFDKLPINHYSRKMLGYVYAIKKGAEFIIDTDDDNIPLECWGFPDFDGKFQSINEPNSFVNIYKYFTDLNIWPRGFPLDKIKDSFSYKFENIKVQRVKIGVWQGLADEDPDVDALYRLLDNELCHFDKKKPIVLSPRTFCPFNSQNTMFRKELFPLLYLPSTVTFRFTDILRSFITQQIMWLYGYSLGFTNATVLQKRNVHDYLMDFESEIPMYIHTNKVCELIDKVISSSKNISENLFIVYEALASNELVASTELLSLEAWLKDIQLKY